MHAKSRQAGPTLCEPMGCSPPGSCIHRILQARILEWVAMPSSRGSSWPKDQTHIACISGTAGRYFTTEPPRKPDSYSADNILLRNVEWLLLISGPTPSSDNWTFFPYREPSPALISPFSWEILTPLSASGMCVQVPLVAATGLLQKQLEKDSPGFADTKDITLLGLRGKDSKGERKSDF